MSVYREKIIVCDKCGYTLHYVGNHVQSDMRRFAKAQGWRSFDRKQDYCSDCLNPELSLGL